MESRIKLFFKNGKEMSDENVRTCLKSFMEQHQIPISISGWRQQQSNHSMETGENLWSYK